MCLECNFYIWSLAPIGGKNNQCHFRDSRGLFLGRPIYVLTFGAGQQINPCHGTVALVRMAPLEIIIFMNLTLDGPLIPSSNHIIGKYTTSSWISLNQLNVSFFSTITFIWNLAWALRATPYFWKNAEYRFNNGLVKSG